MKDQIKEYDTNNYFGKIVEPFAEFVKKIGNQRDVIMRCSPASISSVVDTADCFPVAVVQNVFDNSDCGISGDWYHSVVHDNTISALYYVDLLVRGGLTNDHQPVMKTDTFVFDPNNKTKISACYHLKCNGRYTPPADYLSLRNNLATETLYDASDISLSGLLSPIWKGIKLIQGGSPTK